MDTSCQTDYIIEPTLTKKKLRFGAHLRDKESHSQNTVVELPSIRRHKYLNLSNATESPRGKSNNLQSPTRFPSIFKKYQNHMDN